MQSRQVKPPLNTLHCMVGRVHLPFFFGLGLSSSLALWQVVEFSAVYQKIPSQFNLVQIAVGTGNHIWVTVLPVCVFILFKNSSSD